MNHSHLKSLQRNLVLAITIIAITILCLPATAVSGVANSDPILEPDYYNFAIEYTYYNSAGHDTFASTGRFISLVKTPVFVNNGSATFSDGEIALQVVSITFEGLWRFTATCYAEDGTIRVGEADAILPCTLSFALNQDGSTWRIFSGTLPRAIIPPYSGDIIIEPGYHSVCLGSGWEQGPGQYLINQQFYEYREVYDGPPSGLHAYSQGLGSSERISNYPNFVLTAAHKYTVQYADLDPSYIKVGVAISLESGPVNNE